MSVGAWLRSIPLPAALLLLGAQRHFGYYAFTGEARGLIAMAAGGVAVLCLVWLLVAREPSRLAVAAAAWLTVSEGMVIACPLMYLHSPWPVADGADLCSARAGVQIVLLELVAAAWVARGIASVISDRSGNDREG